MNGRALGTGEQDVRLRKEGGDERTEEFQRAGSQKSRRQWPGAEKQRSAALNVQRQAPRREQEGRKQETESIKTTASNLPETKCRSQTRKTYMKVLDFSTTTLIFSH